STCRRDLRSFPTRRSSDLILSRAVMRDYPQDYAYFGKRQFVWHGRVTRNHNHLLESMPGVDGIKTGFTNASGFNLAASAVRDNRSEEHTSELQSRENLVCR